MKDKYCVTVLLTTNLNLFQYPNFNNDLTKVHTKMGQIYKLQSRTVPRKYNANFINYTYLSVYNTTV